MNDKLKLHSYLTLLKYNKQGKLIEEDRVPNLIVDKGLEYVARLFAGISTDPFKYIAIGSGNTAAVIGDTTLVTEVDRTLAAAAYEASFKAVLTSVFSFSGAATIEEAGVFDDASAGNMYARRVFASKSFLTGESLGVIWTIEFARS